MAPILNFHAGSLASFSRPLRSDDTLASLKIHASVKFDRKLHDTRTPVTVKYRWAAEKYILEDLEDWEVFLERSRRVEEVDIFLESPEIPAKSSQSRQQTGGARTAVVLGLSVFFALILPLCVLIFGGYTQSRYY